MLNFKSRRVPAPHPLQSPFPIDEVELLRKSEMTVKHRANRSNMLFSSAMNSDRYQLTSKAESGPRDHHAKLSKMNNASVSKTLRRGVKTQSENNKIGSKSRT